MSFNIRYGTAEDGPNSWNFRRGLVFRQLDRVVPDLLGLQEALRFQLDELHSAFPEFEETGAGREDGKQAGEYTALLIRTERFEVVRQGTFWFSNTPEIPGSTSWGNRIPRVSTWAWLKDRKTGEAFRIFNLHLDHQSQESRLMSARLLVRQIRDGGGPEAVIVTGDFNAGERNPVIRFLLGEETQELPRSPVILFDTFRKLHPDASIVGTFNGFTGEANGDKIDFILVSKHFKVEEAEILRTQFGDRFPSDHFPVRAVIRRLPE